MKIKHSPLEILPVRPFHFVHTVRSHGWVNLSPNSWDAETNTVHRTQRLSNGKMALLAIHEGGTPKRPQISIDVSHTKPLSQADQNEIVTVVNRMFRADVDLSDFYALCQKRGKQWHPITQGLGRLFRSPTVFEDIVKTMATVNMQWGGTRAMMQRLVDTLGEPFPGDNTKKAFPTPEAIADSSLEFFQKEIRMGFRNQYVITLAQRIVNQEINVEAFKHSDMTTSELKKELKKIKGIGDYAAANVLMLLGRYDEITIDSVCRDFFSKKYCKGEPSSDQDILKKYAKWGEWKFLAFWFEIWTWYHNQPRKP